MERQDTAHDSTDNAYGTKNVSSLQPNSRFDVTRSHDASGYKTVDATRTSIKAQSVDLSRSGIAQNKQKVHTRYFDREAYRPKDFLKVYSKERAESQWLDLLQNMPKFAGFSREYIKDIMIDKPAKAKAEKEAHMDALRARDALRDKSALEKKLATGMQKRVE
jgi:hypothetical protein